MQPITVKEKSWVFFAALAKPVLKSEWQRGSDDLQGLPIQFSDPKIRAAERIAIAEQQTTTPIND